jgi:hypothetical protein
MKPVRGASIDVAFQQDFLTWDPFMVLDGSLYVRDSVNTNNNFSYSASFSINEKLLPFIKYAKAYVNQTHGGYYPKVGNYFASWGFNAGIDVLTAPLFLNIALEAGYIFSYIDLYNSNHEFGVLNNNIDQGDNISQFYIGVRWGYLQ